MEKIQKIEVWAHVIENTEALLERTRLYLDTLSRRAHDGASVLLELEMPGGETPEGVNKAEELLYEIHHALQFVTDSLEMQQHHLREIRTEATEKHFLKAA